MQNNRMIVQAYKKMQLANRKDQEEDRDKTRSEF